MPFKQHPDNPDLVIYKPNEYWIPKPWQGLTGTEINHIFAANVGYPERMCRAIEAKLKEKNEH
jgi:hypothetical protein